MTYRDTSQAAQDVLAERLRQVEALGWTPEHDDEHSHGQLAAAAAVYAAHASADAAVFGQAPNPDPASTFKLQEFVRRCWPWDMEWWKPSNRRRMLVKAGALILAEIERLDRAEKRGA